MKSLITGLVLLMLGGCAGLSQSPPDAREALKGLAANAARGLLASPPWPAQDTPAITILLRPAEVAETLPITPSALNEALGRALLSNENAPHVLDWAPASISARADGQWLLQAELTADSPPLRLSDRTLQPYRLQFDLSQPGGEHWQWQASGALDPDALPRTTESP
ncbi:hypothetical protein [Salinicola sp. CR57]|uniref:hypothetical protein n=1 Tax=Salinicola sp. CR57 TaxID=1949086 RepID=UPI000DA1CB50|nr:hypothetical protein [Salinicola sp. CR57]